MTFLILAVLAYCIFIYKKSWRKIVTYLPYLSIFAILAIIITGIHLYYSGIKIISGQSAEIFFYDLYLTIRSLFIASVGLYFLNNGQEMKDGVYSKVLSGLKKIPKILVILIANGFLFYTAILFDSLIPNALEKIRLDHKELLLNQTLFFASAINEELLIRLGLFGIIWSLLKSVKYKEILVYLITAVFWAFMHVQNTDFIFAKFVQILPFGILLAFLLRKYGFETSLVTHILANALMIVVFSSI